MTLSDTGYGSTMIWFQVCKWLNEKDDIEVSSRLIPLVDEHTHLLIEAEKNKCNERHENAETCRRLYLAVVVSVISLSCPLFYAVFLRTESD